MPRMRLGVALLVPGPAAAEIDGLRRALGDGALGRIPAHLTLVPPVNVPADRLPEALGALRSAAAAVGPLRLRLGPPATFHPVTPVVYLAVGGDVDGLAALRDRVFRPPLARSLTYPFVPHVTLADDLAPERIPAALAALADARLDVTVDRLHLLREESGRIWRPIADAPLAPATVVGRGGLALELTVGERPDPEAVRLLAWSTPAPGAGPATGDPRPPPGPDRVPGGVRDAAAARPLPGRNRVRDAGDAGQLPGPDRVPGGVRDAAAARPLPGRGPVSGGVPDAGVARSPVGGGAHPGPLAGDDPGGAPAGPAAGPLAVVGRRDGEVVGAAHGWTVGPITRLAWLAVAEGARRQGVGAHLLAAVEGEARARGSSALETVAPDSPAATALLSGAGWRPAGTPGSPLPGWRWWHRPLVPEGRPEPG